MSDDPFGPGWPSSPPPAPVPDLRASDADRQRVADALRAHCVAGRLTMDELGTRLRRAYGARTVGELAEVSVDLPELEAHPLPVPVVPAEAPRYRPHRTGSPGRTSAGVSLRAAAAGWAGTAAVAVAIWAGPGDGGYFWPGWILGPLGVVLAARAVAGRRRRR